MSKQNTIDLRRHLRTSRRYIWLFVTIFLFFFGFALIYINISQSRYQTEALLLIENSSDEQPQKSGLMNLMKSFSISGGLGSASVDNEILLLSSHDIIERTIKELNLNIEVSEKDGLFKTLLFNDNPFDIVLSKGLAEKLSEPLFIEATIKNDKWTFKVKQGRYFSNVLFETQSDSLPCTLTSPYGDISIYQSARINPTNDRVFIISIENPAVTEENLYNNVKIEPRDKVSDAILLTIIDIGKERGAAILNEMMKQYNNKRLERKRENSLTEIEFLNERINKLLEEINETEKKIEEYKTDKQFVDIQSEAPILLGEALVTHKDLLITSAEIAYYQQVLDLLSEGSDGMLPAIAVLGNSSDATGPNQLITSYNRELLKVRELEKSALPGNSALERAQQRLANMKSSIIESFSQLLANAKTIQEKQSGASGIMDDKLKNLPTYEKEYIQLYRDNMLLNELYAYLVEKRENAMLQYYSQSSLGFVIDSAHTSIKPSIKRPAIIISGAIILALFIIFTLIIILTKRKQTVDDKMDLADMGIEENSVKITHHNLTEATDKFRGWVNYDHTPKAIFICSLDTTDLFLQSLLHSFRNADIPYEEIKLPSDSNDCILSPTLNTHLSDILQQTKFAVINIPQPQRLSAIAGVINALESRLALIIPTHTISRRELYDMTAPLINDHIFTIIVKS